MTSPNGETRRRGQAANVNWERIEHQYREGVLSNQKIADEHGITEGAIRKRAKRYGWKKDLRARVEIARENALIRSPIQPETPEEIAADEEFVRHAAATQAGLVRKHRRRMHTYTRLVDKLQQQLDLAVVSRDTFVKEIELITANDKTPQRMNAMMRAIALPTHVVAAKDLALAARTLIQLERQAFGLSSDEDPDAEKPKDDAVHPTESQLEKVRARLKARTA